MNDGSIPILFMGVVLGLFIGLLIEITFGNEKMREAFERGYAVQCLGKTGYYWGCKDE